MAPSVTELQRIISMCELELQLLDMLVNDQSHVVSESDHDMLLVVWIF